MKKRWISLFVENEVGVLARISGLFSSKFYNVNSLTVGPTEDPSISRMTISVTSDDPTYEQIKKQLNRSVEVIKVIDYENRDVHIKELMYIKITTLDMREKEEVFRIAETFGLKIVDYGFNQMLVECIQKEEKNDRILHLLQETFLNRIEVVRGGSVAIDAIAIGKR